MKWVVNVMSLKLKRLLGMEFLSKVCCRYRQYGMLAICALFFSIVVHAESTTTFLQENLPNTGANVEATAVRGTEFLVAVMLPSAGSFAEAAEAIRMGILQGWYRSGNRGRLVFFDTSKSDITLQYQEIIKMGAQLVIGPLDKEDLQTLAEYVRAQGKASVPILALNRLENNGRSPAGFYQFGFSPEDEARFVAQHVRDLGLTEMVMLAPEGKWGDRMLAAFKSELDSVGLSLVAARRFNPKERDFKKSLTPLLAPSIKEALAASDVKLSPELVVNMAKKRGFFLAAQPAQARLIMQQIAQNKLPAIPTFGTSHLFEGMNNPKGDGNLNTVEFCDIPWMLDPQGSSAELRREARQYWPNLETRYSRLLALGVDSWQIGQRLSLDPQSVIGFNGVTGTLHLTLGGQIQRRLRWAKFQNGIPQLQE